MNETSTIDDLNELLETTDAFTPKNDILHPNANIFHEIPCSDSFGG